VSELCREHGMSSATFYKWRAKYGGMDTAMISRLKELEAENCSGPLILDTFQATFSNSAIFCTPQGSIKAGVIYPIAE